MNDKLAHLIDGLIEAHIKLYYLTHHCNPNKGLPYGVGRAEAKIEKLLAQLHEWERKHVEHNSPHNEPENL